MKKIQLYVMLASMLFAWGCKDFVTIDPAADQIGTRTVFSTDETAEAAIRGIYAKMMAGGGFADGNSGSVTFLAGRAADDFVNSASNENRKQFSLNSILPENTTLRQSLWQHPYQIIYACNLAMENLQRSNQVSPRLKNQLLGEAKFLRAFCLFYLTNMFGDVPVVLSTDYKVNAVAFASTQKQVYQQVLADLDEAVPLLMEEYPSGERIRVNRWVAKALLARVYLYLEDWEKAELEATALIGHQTSYSLMENLNEVFLKNSREAIWQLVVPMALGVNTNEGSRFILTAAPGSTTEVYLSDGLVHAFEAGDLRQSKWLGSFSNNTRSWYFPFKYKVKSGATTVSEYSMVLRLAEQYLIRAEARIHLGKLQPGIDDINKIRARSRANSSSDLPDPLPELSSDLDPAGALRALEQERRVELFAEWGHRWFDLKRTNRANTVLGQAKAPNWENTDIRFPIPANEILNNQNLVQNDGY